MDCRQAQKKLYCFCIFLLDATRVLQDLPSKFGSPVAAYAKFDGNISLVNLNLVSSSSKDAGKDCSFFGALVYCYTCIFVISKNHFMRTD